VASGRNAMPAIKYSYLLNNRNVLTRITLEHVSALNNGHSVQKLTLESKDGLKL
jgi:hypothetical protein